MSKKRKAPGRGHATGAIGKIIQEKYNTLDKETQEQLKKESLHDIIGGIGIFWGLCVLVVLMLIVGEGAAI